MEGQKYSTKKGENNVDGCEGGETSEAWLKGRPPVLWVGGLVSAWGLGISPPVLPSNCQIETGIDANWQASACGSATICGVGAGQGAGGTSGAPRPCGNDPARLTQRSHLGDRCSFPKTDGVLLRPGSWAGSLQANRAAIRAAVECFQQWEPHGGDSRVAL
ncbi:hypothetical protein EYF80_008910 [Liparis tanakae]|uniref:Uncharacterized protein n=1 Tax=Liparis tanakae TaxID=230148 RepID=A0A4Z2ISM6_9TELE|nr:hypothetical protein EYF80_008910 [Liparis tanakae]